MLAAALDLLFPPRCAACAALGPAAGPFCAVCAGALLPIGDFRCPACGLPYEGQGTPHLCEHCERRPPSFDSARAGYVLGGPIADAIHRFKYADRPHLAAPLARLLADLAPPGTHLLLAIPLHPGRLATRGYDQAMLLARPLARLSGKGLGHIRALRRTRDTPPQVSLDRAGRAANVAGAFIADPRRVAGRNILLVDDVLTTGATAEECARVLKKAGASRVDVLTVARAV